MAHKRPLKKVAKKKALDKNSTYSVEISLSNNISTTSLEYQEEIIDFQEDKPDSYVPVGSAFYRNDRFSQSCDPEKDLTLSVEREPSNFRRSHQIHRNKRLKIGILQLSRHECLPFSTVGQLLLEAPSVKPPIFSEKTLRVLKEITYLEGNFRRGSLTKRMRNSGMNAAVIKEHLEILVSEGVLGEVASTGSQKTGGRPKSEQYKVLWTEDAINVFLKEREEDHPEPFNTMKEG